MAIAVNCCLAVYFLVGFLIARQIHPATPATVLRAAHFSSSWPLARLLWTLALLLALGLVGGALARRGVAPRPQRGRIAALSLVALVSVAAALPASPARPPLSPRTFDVGTAINDTAGYARAGLLFVLSALLYAGAALASRRD